MKVADELISFILEGTLFDVDSFFHLKTEIIEIHQ